MIEDEKPHFVLVGLKFTGTVLFIFACAVLIFMIGMLCCKFLIWFEKLIALGA